MGVLRDLSQSECRAHLAEQQVARVAVVAPDGPHIIPVNYALVDEHLIFRTAALTVLASFGPQSTVAVEVEQTDGPAKAGWSVVARGRVEIIRDRAELDHVRQIWEPQPWAGGDRSVYLRVRIRQLSGRSVGLPLPLWAPLAEGPAGWGPMDHEPGALWH